MLEQIAGWEILQKLGEGGQGEVFLAESPATRVARDEAIRKLSNLLLNVARNAVAGDWFDELSRGLSEFSQRDNRRDVGALKQFKMPNDVQEKTRALRRLQNEITALEQVKGDPAAIQVLDSNVTHSAAWMVTEYHPSGSLDKHLNLFKGDAVGALAALRPLIALVAKIHDRGIVHRDIKPHNILVADDGHLILGDFGIVFLDANNRATDSFEKVGTRDWMPPWAYTGRRIDEVKPNFDVFCLAKVLWAMISGRHVLPFWEYNRPEYDLTQQFPNDPDMYAINSRILSHCIVREEADCESSAELLLHRVDSILTMFRRRGQLLEGSVPRPCHVCGLGSYKIRRGNLPLLSNEPMIRVDIYACGVCNHIQFFESRIKDMINSPWIAEKGQGFYTFGDEPDDPVQPLTWGANPEHDEQLLKEGRVLKTKEEAESARTLRFG